MASHVEYTSPQAPNTTVTGVQRDSQFPYHNYTKIRLTVANTGDICHLYIEQMEDGGSVWKETGRVPVAGDGGYRTFEFPINMRFYRISLQVGTSQSALFVLSTPIPADGNFIGDKTLTFEMYSGALVSGGTSTQTTLNLGDCHNFDKIRSVVNFDQNCTLVVEQSNNGSSWRRADSVDLSPNVVGTPQAINQESLITGQYIRSYIVNSGNAQGANFEHILALVPR